jgi:formate-dependent nitrite reductase cytochrome c552 subunit
MQLTVDSSACEDCHTSTFEQWGHSRHAQAGVQCIGCHLSHSQEFRLTDEALCGSCHRDRLEDFTHTAHGTAGVACIDCHLSSTATEQIALVSTGPGDRSLTPSHDFTGVLSEDCVSCHGQDIHDSLPDTGRAVDPRLLAMAESVPALTAKLETAQQSNKSLQIMAPVCLGLGIGIGGMLGIIFMLVVGYINQRRAK